MHATWLVRPVARVGTVDEYKKKTIFAQRDGAETPARATPSTPETFHTRVTLGQMSIDLTPAPVAMLRRCTMPGPQNNILLVGKDQ